MPNRVSGPLAYWVAFLAFVSACYGGGFSVTPVRMELSARQTTSILTVENPSPQKRSYQVTVVDWDQQDGVDSFEPARTAFAVPPMFSISSGGRQLVRIGLTQSGAPAERCYRILVQELPLPMPMDASRVEIQTLLRVSVPVFVAGGAGRGGHEPAALRWTAVEPGSSSTGGACFLVENLGARHVQIQKLHWKGVARTFTLGAYYLLPNRKRELCLPEARAGDLPASGMIATTDHGEFPYEVLRKTQ